LGFSSQTVEDAYPMSSGFSVEQQHAERMAIVPWMVEEPVGRARLLWLARWEADATEHGADAEDPAP
jgi:hypothetical protein